MAGDLTSCPPPSPTCRTTLALPPAPDPDPDPDPEFLRLLAREEPTEARLPVPTPPSVEGGNEGEERKMRVEHIKFRLPTVLYGGLSGPETVSRPEKERKKKKSFSSWKTFKWR